MNKYNLAFGPVLRRKHGGVSVAPVYAIFFVSLRRVSTPARQSALVSRRRFHFQWDFTLLTAVNGGFYYFFFVLKDFI